MNKQERTKTINELIDNGILFPQTNYRINQLAEGKDTLIEGLKIDDSIKQYIDNEESRMRKIKSMIDKNINTANENQKAGKTTCIDKSYIFNSKSEVCTNVTASITSFFKNELGTPVKVDEAKLHYIYDCFTNRKFTNNNLSKKIRVNDIFTQECDPENYRWVMLEIERSSSIDIEHLFIKNYFSTFIITTSKTYQVWICISNPATDVHDYIILAYMINQKYFYGIAKCDCISNNRLTNVPGYTSFDILDTPYVEFCDPTAIMEVDWNSLKEAASIFKTQMLQACPSKILPF